MITFNNTQLLKSDLSINTCKKELKTCQKSKKIFYLENLKYGKDCRQEGLSWIIRIL